MSRLGIPVRQGGEDVNSHGRSSVVPVTSSQVAGAGYASLPPIAIDPETGKVADTGPHSFGGIPGLMDAQQLADFLAIPKGQVYKLRSREGALPPAIKLPGGKLIRWRIADVIAWCDSIGLASATGGTVEPAVTELRQLSDPD